MSDKAPSVVVKQGPFEMSRLVPFIQHHVQKGWRFAALYLLLIAAALFIAACMLILRLSNELTPYVPALIFLVLIALVVAMVRGMQFANRRIRERWYARGIPRELTMSYTIAEAGLRYSCELEECTIYWPSVSEIVLHNHEWLFFVNAAAYFVPRDCFATPADEKAFISTAFDRLTPEARARSQKAETFVASLAAL